MGFDCQSKLLRLCLLGLVQTDVEVLAETTPSDNYKAPHLSVWITDHPKAEIVGIALGHELNPYQQILTNAANWASGK